MNTSSPRNRLSSETSPYLLQHADNPVDWYPWGEEALTRARAENKPILLSIGYSACHWCHVMAHESFEDAETAALMNSLFVNIKVDREERPDLDRIYQLAQQMLTQRGGGWPLTMFLSPQDQRPFFGGTYFPKQARQGMPAFKDLLQRVVQFYGERGEDIARQAEALTQAFAQLQAPAFEQEDLTPEPLARAREMLASEFDPEYGGFGPAPKFPNPTNLALLLRLWRSTASSEEPDLHSLYMATLTLTRMAEGGIRDQIGGGFCRYSVDRYWMIPHFEKMLYDNAQLLSVYAQAALATGDALFARVVDDTAGWIAREMQAPEGAFFSALDADTEGHEGRYYAWDLPQVLERLAPEEFSVFAPRFGLDREPNFEGQWHLHAHRSVTDIAQELGIADEHATDLINNARTKLLVAREQRTYPQRDDKILTAWNALTISALAYAARTANKPALGQSAHKALEHLRNNAWRDGRLFASYKAGTARFPAYLDDHAFMIVALLDMLQLRWRNEDLTWAIQLADLLLQRFEDPEHGGFFFTADDHESLMHRSKTFMDEALPSGNGVAAQALIRLGYLIGEERYLLAAERCLRAGWSYLERYPHAHASMLTALDEYFDPPQMLIVRGDATECERWQAQLAKLYSPRQLVFAIPHDTSDLHPSLSAKAAREDTIAYVCKGVTCSEPVKSLASLIALTRH